ncbi:MAG: rhomboid family intramembrane serine protease, partial [Planctomycetota bacterium]
LYGLWLLGGIYERLSVGKWMLGVFFVSVLASSGMGALVYDIHTPMVGASGGVYGLFASVLAFYYTKTGSIQGMFRLQQSRQLLIWLGIGIFMSISIPNVSLVGHLAGFVPGAVLGYYYEHWYSRKVDFYHKASAIAVVAMTVAVAAYACFPYGRASLSAVQAMKAYEAGEMDRGNLLMEEANEGRRIDDGTKMLMDHLKIWRNFYYKKKPHAEEVLTWPKLHTDPIPSANGDYRAFLNPKAFPSVIVDDTASDVEDAASNRGEHGDE